MESVQPIGISVSGIRTHVAPAFASIVFGVFVVFVVGFLQSPVAHNAAHDTRHANGFPCH